MFKMEINIDRHGTVFIPGKFVNSTNKLKQMLSFFKSITNNRWIGIPYPRPLVFPEK
jgi:hypothetical protein